MCGRFVLIESLRMMQNLFGYRLPEGYDGRVLDMGNRYNIAPTQPILIVVAGERQAPGSNLPERRAMLFRWQPAHCQRKVGKAPNFEV